MDDLSVPLVLLHNDQHRYHDDFGGGKHIRTTNNMFHSPKHDNDVAITPSTRRGHDRVSREYAEIDTAGDNGDGRDNEEASHKIVVGFLVPALLIVQWGVEWHNDDALANVTEQALAVCSLLSILFFMVLAPCFIQTTSAAATTTRQNQYKSLTPIVLLCLADIFVVLRLYLVALTIMILGNVYMAGVLVIRANSSSRQKHRMGRRNNVVPTSELDESMSTSPNEDLLSLASGTATEQQHQRADESDMVV